MTLARVERVGVGRVTWAPAGCWGAGGGQKGAGDRGGEGFFPQGLPGDGGGESSPKPLSLPCVRGRDRMWE